MTEKKRESRSFPWGHIVMGVSGWVGYLFQTHVAVLVLAIVLSLLAVPRFIRGPKERAAKRVAAKLRRPRRPSRRTRKYLLDEEDFLMELYEHPISLLLWWLGGIAWSAAAAAIAYYWLWQVGLGFWVVGMVPLLVRVILWRLDKICLTNRRIFSVQGFTKLTVAQIPLKQVTDKSFTIPWPSMVLAWLRLIETEYGVMKLETAGEGINLASMRVPHVVEVNALIMEQALG